MRRSGLGRGLGSLIPTEVEADRTSTLLELPIGAVRPNRHQPRTSFDEEALASLAASVAEVGILQPILVRALAEGDDPERRQYELVAGERRWRAAKRAGLQTIPALVRDISDGSSVEQALVENLHREDLNALEEAAAYQQLLDDFALTHEQVAQRVGRSRVAISNTLRLLHLPPSIQRLVRDGQLSGGHARALLGTPDRSFQEGLARRAATEGLSVRAVEEAVRARGGGPQAQDDPAPARPRKLRPPGLLELEELLSTLLDTKVSVDMGAKRGKVVIDFASLEDLERIYRVMTEGRSA